MISFLVCARLWFAEFFWAIILGSRAQFGKEVRIYEEVKLAVEPGGKLKIGDRAAFQKGVVVCVKPSASLEIGEDVYLGEYCVLMTRASIKIGRGTMIAPHCTIVDYNHVFDSADTIMRPDLTDNKSVEIGKNVWVGAGCQILRGVTLGDGCVVGAGSTVTKDVAPFSVVAGVPAKVLKTRQGK